MQNPTIIIVITILALTTLACGTVGGVRGSGNVVTETRAVRDFTGVELASFGNLHIEFGEKEELRIEAEKNIVQYIETQYDGAMLKIKSRPGFWLRPTKPVNFYLTVTQLDTIVLSGSGNVDAPDLEAPDLEVGRIALTIGGSGNIIVGDLDAAKIAVKISGSGDITAGKCDATTQEIRVGGSGSVDLAGINAEALEVRIPGSGKVTVDEGKVETQVVNIGGSGKYRAKSVESDRADVTISGSGTATVSVTESLDACISGSGDIAYAGQPKVTQSISGSGDIKSLSE